MGAAKRLLGSNSNRTTKMMFSASRACYGSRIFKSVVLTPFPIILCGKIVEKFGSKGLVYIILYVSYLVLLKHFKILKLNRGHAQAKPFVFRFVLPMGAFLIARYLHS